MAESVSAGSEGMSTVTGSTPTKPTGGKTPVDTMSREDLLKHVKRQTALLQKMKARTDQLSKECSQLKSEKSGESGQNTEALATELQVLKAERDQTVVKLRNLQQNLTEQKSNAEKENKELSQEIAKLKTNYENTKESLVYQETERARLEEKCSGLALEITKLSDEADTREQDLLSHKATLAEVREERNSLVSECETLRHKAAEWEEERKNLASGAETRERVVADRLQAVVKEKEELVEEVNKLRGQLGHQEQTAMAKSVALKETVTQLEEKLGQTEEKIDAMERKNGELEKVCSELQAQMKASDEALKHQLEVSEANRSSAEQKLKDLQAECVSAKTNEELVSRLEEEKRNLLVKLTDGVEKLEAFKKEDTELRHKLEEATNYLEEERRSRELAMEEKEKSVLEVTKLTEQFAEKEGEVVALQQKLSKLTQCREEVEEIARNEKTTVTEKLDELRKENEFLKTSLADQSAGHKEETKKLKILIIKLKKELSEMKEKAVTATQNSDLSKELIELKEQLSRTDQLVETERTKSAALNDECQGLKDQLEAALKREVALKGECQQLHSIQHEQEEEIGLLTSKLSAAQADITTAQSEASTCKLATENYMAQLIAAKEALDKEQTAMKETLQKLDAAEKEAKASSVMDLELADYRRSAESLKKQLEEKDAHHHHQDQLMAAHVQQLEVAKKELEAARQQSSQHEETTSKLKALLRKTKLELADVKSQLGEAQKVSESLKDQLEEERQHSEGSKVEIAQLTSEIQTLHQQTTSDVSRHQQLVHSLEQQLLSAQGLLASRETALSQLQQDYDSYKIRVHSVLKQKSTAPSATEIESSLRQQFELEILKLKAELKNTQDQLSSILTSHDELMSEHSELSSHHDQLLTEAEQEKKRLLDKLCVIEGKHQAASHELEEQRTLLQQETTRITTAFKLQIHDLQQQHQKKVEGLKKELIATHAELSRLQQEADTYVLSSRPPSGPTPSSSYQRTRSEKPRRSEEEDSVRMSLPSSLPVPPEERSSGEGMDHSELESIDTPSTVPPSVISHTASFERLLSTSDAPPTMKLSQEEREQELEIKKLQKQLQSALQKVTHLAELLHESEANCVRLGDQAKLLKEEIRRLERNQVRHESVSNMEYLKNIVLKFLHSTSNEEKQSLIPVITRLLQLSQQERTFLQETIKGNPSELPDASGVSKGGGVAKGWGSYVQRWTGY